MVRFLEFLNLTMRFHLSISENASLLKSTLEFISDSSALKSCGKAKLLYNERSEVSRNAMTEFYLSKSATLSTASRRTKIRCFLFLIIH